MDPLTQYLNQISRYPLLTKNQEIILARQMHDWYNNPDATPRQQKLGKRAYHKLINCNLRLVVNIAKRYKARAKRTELLDIIQEGNLGLAHGLKKFDPERGYALSTYIYWWIRQGITRFLSVSDRLIRLPSGASDILNKIRYWLPEFQREHGRMPTVAECADYCNTTPNRMEGYLTHLVDCGSTDAAVRGRDGELTVMETISDGRPCPLQRLELAMGLESLDALLGFLSDADRDILEKYYGVGGEPAMSLQAIGVEYSVSRERIRQRANKSLLKLRLHAAGIKVQDAA